LVNKANYPCLILRLWW